MNLGQHFLVNEETIKRFVSYVDLSFRPIIEIGGGKGNITKYIKPDVVIEIDKRFSSYLRNLVIADARFLPVIRGQIVSSLPYYITYEFFEEIIRIDQIKKLILILQYDFVKKILNEPTYISFILNYYYKIDVKENIPPWFFKPKPRVYSTIVLFTRIRSYDEKINLILKCISKYRNKKITNAVKLCNLSSSLSTDINKRVRDFKPCQVLELLNIISTKYV
ncbi:16S ribosomal RNA methyltransferase A [Sulfurisphaera tokodaii]|uniref:rRNA methyltransferase n=2 Tax=Sulfurisphaera tokodaii TaxID=111955 RepID=Q975F5_SULTO|nr:16S ribosomal RNA methyltransferase A [Sulfurisphaera tokodaii]BAB65446.1 putative rRNA methyltransferase [Sulfurisphaera tokodaii str. 7]HII74855.1 16S ribosomal RNA methyltransferase A [Sulfurisphaera tokodaii]